MSSVLVLERGSDILIDILKQVSAGLSQYEPLYCHIYLFIICLHPPKTPFVSGVGGPDQQTTLERISGVKYKKKTCHVTTFHFLCLCFEPKEKAGWVLLVMH